MRMKRIFPRHDVSAEPTGIVSPSRREALKLLLFGAAGTMAGSMLTACAQESKPEAAPKAAAPMTPAMSSAQLKAAAPAISTTYPYELPPLPYEYDAVSGVIIERIMRIHHDRHHNGYTSKLNAALENSPELQSKPLVELLSNLDALPASVRTAVRNNGGGYFNHALFWPMLSANGGGEPGGELAAAITRDFGTLDAMKESFSSAAKSVFGSGWAWLALNGEGKLEILQTPNQDTPLATGHKPVLGIDVWEHAYYLQYENRRGEYVDNFWNIVNWKQVEQNFAS